MYKLLCLFVIMLGCILYGQQTQPVYIIEGDTLTNPFVDLSEVVVLPSMKFNTYNDYVTYYHLQRRTLKVYPYAKLAAERLTVLNQRLAKIKRKRAKKSYAKQIERYLEREFKDQLKHLIREWRSLVVR